MDSRDLLLTIAEVAIAFAGFASLAAVVATTSERSARMNAMRFRTLLQNSITTVAFCFVPFVPPHYGFSTNASWGVSSLLLAAVVAAEHLLFIRLYGGSNPTAASARVIALWQFLAWLPVVLAILGPLGVGSIVGNYILALLTLLAASALSFLRVFGEFLPFNKP